MLASFPWYDLPSVQWANDTLWRATGYPGELNRDLTVSELWHNPDLLVTQACGLDLFLSNAPIEPIAAPVFDLDCDAGMYFSYILGNASGRVAAVNSLSSRSGWSALLSVCTPQKVVVTGSHQASLEALRTGVADVAAIDAVTLSIIKRDSPAEIAGLEVVDRSSNAPSPPYVVRRGVDRKSVFRSLQNALVSPGSKDSKNALHIKGIVAVERPHYFPVLTEYNTHSAPASRDGAIVFDVL
ncbi:MAG: ABC-type phosphate/phosphonate transport system substrate-binding protein [Candidatus Azotimanducaceae bacterium]|jgi:ABC-type phosphate/phosphonate transport system substrate-binding protein